MRVLATIVLCLSVAGAVPTMAQTVTPHDHHMPTSPVAATPLEPGNAAFATIAEIVTILSAAPSTDWSKVNIDALREHLVDMDNVMLRATVKTVDLPGGARFEVAGAGPVADSIRRMALAQTKMLDGREGIHIVSEPTATGASMTVTGNETSSETRIRALGFFGLITGGSHHQSHHLMIATGSMPH